MCELELNQRRLSATPACDGGKLLTSIWGVGRGSVEEPGGARHSQVHAGVAVAVHAVADGVVARLLRGAAGDVAPRGHAAGVPAVAHWKKAWWGGSKNKFRFIHFFPSACSLTGKHSLITADDDGDLLLQRRAFLHRHILQMLL